MIVWSSAEWLHIKWEESSTLLFWDKHSLILTSQRLPRVTSWCQLQVLFFGGSGLLLFMFGDLEEEEATTASWSGCHATSFSFGCSKVAEAPALSTHVLRPLFGLRKWLECLCVHPFLVWHPGRTTPCPCLLCHWARRNLVELYILYQPQNAGFYGTKKNEMPRFWYNTLIIFFLKNKVCLHYIHLNCCGEWTQKEQIWGLALQNMTYSCWSNVIRWRIMYLRTVLIISRAVHGIWFKMSSNLTKLNSVEKYISFHQRDIS